MLKRSVIKAGLAGLVGLTLAATLGATTLEPLDGEQMTDAAQVIVVGECTEQRTEWFGRSLVTLYTVSVNEVIKGTAPGQITVAVPGGLDTEGPVPVAVTFPGAPTLQPGEQLLLFLHDAENPTNDLAPSKAEDAMFGIVGFSQGAFPVIAEDGASWVSQSKSSRQGAMPLDVVKQQIQNYMTSADRR